MPLIEGFHIQNYRALRDVTLGKVYSEGPEEPLTQLTAVIGKNGVGKSTLFDAFGFLADCLNHDVETACQMRGRGGFERLISRKTSNAIFLEIRYREQPDESPISYKLEIALDGSGRPFVRSEFLRQLGEGQPMAVPLTFLGLREGKGIILANEVIQIVGDVAQFEEEQVEITDPQRLAIATFGTLKEHPLIQRFRDFMKGWYLSYFYPDAARGLPMSGPQRHLNERGDNLGNVVQYMEREHKERFQAVLQKIASKIPGINSIETKETEDKRLLLRFNDGAFTNPFLADQMSDGTLKLFAYLLLLEDPEPPSLICIEEPENGLYHKLLDSLATELRNHATGEPGAPQVFVTTHQPYFVDALSPKEVWILDKGKDGFATIQRASDIELVRNLVTEGLPLGGLWYSDYLDPR
jgi:predicted ATPase